MKKVSKLVLMFCFILSGAFSYADGTAGPAKENCFNLEIIQIKQKIFV